jgi:hypothetical protein
VSQPELVIVRAAPAAPVASWAAVSHGGALRKAVGERISSEPRLGLREEHQRDNTQHVKATKVKETHVTTSTGWGSPSLRTGQFKGSPAIGSVPPSVNGALTYVGAMGQRRVVRPWAYVARAREPEPSSWYAYATLTLRT